MKTSLIIFSLLVAIPLVLCADKTTGTFPTDSKSSTAKSGDEAAWLYENHTLWPLKVHATRDIEVPDGRVPARTRGTLVRIEPDGTARVDFGRSGIQNVPVTKTDILAQAHAIRDGDQDPDRPNFVMLMGTRLGRTDLEYIQAYPYDQFTSHDLFLILYLEGLMEFDEELAESFRKVVSLSQEHGVLPFVHTTVPTKGLLLAHLLQVKLETPIPYVVGHLQEPMARVMGHNPHNMPMAVLVNEYGKVLAKAHFPDDPEAAVETIRQAIKEQRGGGWQRTAKNAD